jgi:hypothetical protein
MLTQSLIHQLQQLTHSDKLSAMQLLIESLRKETDLPFDAQVSYEVWSPYDSAQTAADLMSLLEKDEASPDA